MIRKVMIPTDGSDESAKAVRIAEQIARAHGAEVLIVRVIEPMEWQYGFIEVPVDPNVYEEMVRTVEDQSITHVSRLEAELSERGIKARGVIRHGFDTAELLDCEQDERPDLVVMTTHGRTGLARFALGSVADRIVREGATPVLLVRLSTPVDVKLESALVMLDGSGVAEQAIPITEELAGKPLTSITLFQSVADPDDREPAKTYLNAIAEKLGLPECPANVVVDVGDVRHTVERVARDRDLVILATHGHGGFDRVRHGSVAEAVVRRVENPVLLVHARG
jgi:nucleotide-binding universal stress UspA family protein